MELLVLEPHVDARRKELMRILCELLKLPVEQLLLFHVWFCSLSRDVLLRLVRLLSIPSTALLDLKRRLSTRSVDKGLLDSGLLLRVPSADSAGFSPPTALPTHLAGPMKTSIGSLDLGAISMDMGPDVMPLDADWLNEPLHSGSSGDLSKFGVGRFGSSGDLARLGGSGELGRISPTSMLGLGVDALASNINNNNNAGPAAVAPATNSSRKEVARIAVRKPRAPAAVVVKQEFDDDDEGDDMDDGDYDEVSPPSIFASADFGDVKFQLRIVVQPASKTVYQRILRPHPTVMLEGAEPGANYFVGVTLVLKKSPTEPLACFTGNSNMKISNGVYASFKKLKITMTTTQMQSENDGGLFMLRFQLKTFNGNSFADVPGVFVLSNEVEVFSHTHYLTNKKKGYHPAAPTVADCIPQTVRTIGGEKLVLLGSNFVRNPALRVRFSVEGMADVEVPANFHEAGTLWVCVPSMTAGQYIVSASNDGQEWVQLDGVRLRVVE